MSVDRYNIVSNSGDIWPVPQYLVGKVVQRLIDESAREDATKRYNAYEIFHVDHHLDPDHPYEGFPENNPNPSNSE